MLSGCGGLRGSGVLGGVIGACWGIPSTLRPSILTPCMGSPRCIQREINIIDSTGKKMSPSDSLSRDGILLQLTGQIWDIGYIIQRYTVLLLGTLFARQHSSGFSGCYPEDETVSQLSYNGYVSKRIIYQC